MSRQHSIVEHKSNYFYIPLEDDYLALFEDMAALLDPRKAENGKKLSGPSDCKAMIASVLEAWMNSKRPTARCEEDLYVYMTYDEWEIALRYRYKRSTIIQCLQEMEIEGMWCDTEGKYGEEGLEYIGTIKKSHFVQNTYKYMLHLPVVQGMLSALPDQSPFDQKPRPSLGRPRKNRVEINGINLNGLKTDDNTEIPSKNKRFNEKYRPKINAPFYTQITNNTDLNNTHRESTAPESDTPPVSPPVVGALTLSPQSETQSQQGDAHGYANNDLADLASDHVEYLPGMPDSRSTGTAQRQPPTSKKGQIDVATPSRDISRESARGRNRGSYHNPLAQPTLANTPTPSPAQASPPQSEQAALGQAPKGKGKKQVEVKTETPKGPPTEPPSDMPWGTRKCLLWFDFWRGGILIGKWKLMQASTCAKGLAEQFSEQQVIETRTMMEADPYYVEKGGCDVCDVANNIHKYLKRKQQGQKPGSTAPVIQAGKRFSSYDDPNFRSDRDFYPVEGGSYATVAI